MHVAVDEEGVKQNGLKREPEKGWTNVYFNGSARIHGSGAERLPTTEEPQRSMGSSRV